MSRATTVAQILGAWQEGREAGAYVDPEEVIAAHPELADELRAHFLAAQAVEQAYAETRFLQGETPRRIGDYEIVREIGRGGMGIVYEAFQTSMRRRVALKVLFPGRDALEARRAALPARGADGRAGSSTPTSCRSTRSETRAGSGTTRWS